MTPEDMSHINRMVPFPFQSWSLWTVTVWKRDACCVATAWVFVSLNNKKRCLHISDWCCITACFIIFSSCLSMGMTPWRPFMRLLFLFTTTNPRTRTASEFPWQHAASPPAHHHHNLIPETRASLDMEISSQIPLYHVLQPEETS